ncbi:MupA/Atu3671 family FMN-dependent luciferase-like monooxygenase [Ramlibacter algicola]|uniref:LLM class flavin-dependent oxidoreductase n=1 Tax=Ramlibacter algicola TaxID=2795217 RepID=A0A934USP6_9BURK|nr:MupA/Atu3671 family FMN-dependent luciferase-like monooxygenase [Ramlibacter algicola]MBK0394480.1 LLM class flavin-dependent oxidoreductase [Ramlibacter algicola]
MTTTTAVFVGDGSLLVQCAEAWRRAGHSVAAVVSGSSANLDWARAQDVRAIAMEGEWGAQLDGLRFDYLFSVANLRMLPQAVLERAGQLAINFHDALLPRYAGLNATCWALMAGEGVHGVTWHEMTARADAGRIVRQGSFEVSPAETALSLNAKCYEAGLAAFTQIADDIAHDRLALAAQSGERTYFGRHKRPALLATLDFTRPAQELAALVRALDFGQYANPLGRAKVLAGDELVLVRSAEVRDGLASAAPGTVLGVQGDTLRVAALGGELVLGGCTTLEGGAPRVQPGAVLGVPEAARSRLQDRLDSIAKGESHWTDVLHALAPVELPYPRRNEAGVAGVQKHHLGVAPPAPVVLAAFHAWLSMLTGQERTSVLYTDASLQEQAHGLEPWLDAWVPMTASVPPTLATLQFTGVLERTLSHARSAGPLTRDLPSRLGERSVPLAALRKVALALAPQSLPAGCEALLTVDARGDLELLLDDAVFAPDAGVAMAAQLQAWLHAFAQGQGPIGELPLLPSAEQDSVARLSRAASAFDKQACVHTLIAAQAARTPEQVAVTTGPESLTYAQLEEQSTALANRLVARGVRAGDIVGLCLPRTPALLVAVLATMKAGAAYLPLDPEYPKDRLQFMVEDANAPVVLVSAPSATAIDVDAGRMLRIDQPEAVAPQALPEADARRPAYVIYTSGSTGKPKGVVVTQRNVMNFFAGMDERVPREEGSKWLAVTSLSFDISVLELYWTLARGVTVVLHSDTAAAPVKAPEFSLFYFASDESSDTRDSYRLLLEGAKFADREGFSAVWTPERHFHAFGGLYPNPVVTAAALATMTTRVQIRAGSCVIPLHHPVRVAEDWAFVDNLSNGRVGISFASGWQPNDFVLAPQNFANRQQVMVEHIDTVRRLWKGEAVPFPGPKGDQVPTRTLPRPVQQDIPVWITAAGNPKTFEQAGTMGCRLLTHLLGQTVDDVAEKLRLYRAAWKAAGHPGEGHVTLMLHTYVDDDEDRARETARQPMKNYLRGAMDLVRKAAWTFPTFVQRAAADGRTPQEIMDAAPLSPAETDALLDHAFQRYYGSSALIGTPQRCLDMVRKVQDAGVDEIACLVDFGIAPDTVLASLPQLKALMEASRAPAASTRRVSVAENALQHGVTHLQCTPSMAAMLLADAPGRAALSRLRAMMVGGEALPLEMATQLRSLVPGALLNMYGPTETTVWSTTANLEKLDGRVPLGEPIANTQLSIRTPWGAECPALVPGELFIGGDGVTDGYLHRPELNAERFVQDANGARWYRTGDLVRRLPDGSIDFLGRIDHQVKLRGHRIELGEIESVLLRQDGVKQAVVVARDDASGQKFLAGYVTGKPGTHVQGTALREAVARALPEIMVPAVVMVLPALPMTPNGKVDRKQLPDPRVAAAPRSAIAPENAMETTIAGIWQDVLGLEAVGTTENFFDLGGHSLLVVQVQRRLREATGQEVPITDMFRLPTIRALAAHLSGGAQSTAVSQGQSRAQARRMLRNRHLATPTA